jgi:hypothetical protein
MADPNHGLILVPGRPRVLSPIVEDRDSAELDLASIDAVLDRVSNTLAVFCDTLSTEERIVLGRLLEAVREHPFIGDDRDPSELRLAALHVPDEVKRCRDRGRAIAGVVLQSAETRQTVADATLCGRSLGAKLSQFLADLGRIEALSFAEILSNALGGLSPSGAVPTIGWRAAAWLAAIDALTCSAQGGWRTVRQSSLIDGVRLRALVQEASAQYWLAVRMGLRMTGPPGRVARAVGSDPALCQLVSDVMGCAVEVGNGVTGSENATYLYYDGPGDGVQPHVDPFGLVNALVMLECCPPSDGGAGSHLIVFPAKGKPERVALSPGDIVVLRGAGTVHSREPLRPGEQITILSLVFHHHGYLKAS